ncbi:MAG: molybdopterin molybdotransferase [Chthoniobacter sp.]|jgi:molybdopterin molybdotransferase|nr:molybdopterin molybdotransferase [Chthoniobacter sp.]
MITLDEARSIIRRVIDPREPVSMPLAEARGCVLREAVLAPEDFPPFDRSAMDGYVIREGDPAERFRVIGEVRPGSISSLRLGPGECARIFTGAAIPSGGSQVIMQEDVACHEGWMTPRTRDAALFVRRRGEDAAAGDPLVPAGMRLGPAELALLAQVGCLRPQVSPPARAVHFTTGDELVDPATTPAEGQIRDSNSTLIAALLAQSGAALVHQGRCDDDLASLVAGVRALEGWDALLLSGGASVGDYDFGVAALRELGFAIHFERVSLRPGKPLVFGTRGRQIAFVIPGNPVSHFVVFHVAIRLALEALEGAPQPLEPVAAVLDGELVSDSRETCWPAAVRLEGGRLMARPLVWQSSGDLCGLVGVNGLLRLLPRTGPWARGAEIDCLLLDSRL